MSTQHTPPFPLLRSLLGKEGYIRFQEKCLLTRLQDIGREKQASIEKIMLAITHGREIPTREEVLNYQTATTRAGGALLKLSIDLPELQICSFAKIHSDKGKARREITLNKILAEELKAGTVLEPRYADEKLGVIATEFLNAHNALDLYRHSNVENKDIVLDKCLDALLYTYTKTAQADKKIQKKLSKIVPADNEHYATRLQKRVLDRIAGKKVDASKLIELYTRDIHDVLANEKYVLLHGDPHLSNFIILDKAYIIDWERARYGTIFTDIYKLFSRANPNEETRQKLLDKTWKWANRHGIAGSKEDFLRKYGRAEINELLFTTADLIDASRKAPKETKATFEKAANAYYTIAVASARKQKLYDLEQGLTDTANKIGIEVLPDAEFARTFSEAGLHVHGLSTLFDHSIPEEKEKIGDALRANIRRRAKNRFFTKLGLYAAIALTAVGVGAAATTQKTQTRIEHSFNDIGHRIKMEYPDGRFDICEVSTWSKNPLVQKFSRNPYYWMTIFMEFENNELNCAVPKKLARQLMWKGELVFDSKGYCRGRGLVNKYCVKYGLSNEITDAIFWTNILEAPYRRNENRDEITLLPNEVMDAIDGKQRNNRSVEERVDIAIRHLRDCFERSGMIANDAIAEYYFGIFNIDRAKNSAREKKLEKPDNFWTYCEFLPEGKEMAVHALIAYKQMSDTKNADGFPEPDAVTEYNIRYAYENAQKQSSKK